MKVWLVYDTDIDAWALRHRDGRIETADDISEWRRRSAAFRSRRTLHRLRASISAPGPSG